MRDPASFPFDPHPSDPPPPLKLTSVSLLRARSSVVLLQACANNPTGVDPTPAQWDIIMAILREQQLLPLLDCAYQGFASGDLDVDAYSTRKCEAEGIEFIVCQSFAKNMGIYGEL
jgi:aspartate/tyrosine/aromatic aminotransferase